MARQQKLARELVAANTLELVTTWSTWIHRRVETLRFQSARVVERTLEVEFSVPPDILGGQLEQVHVPVAFVSKGQVSSFRVFDEGGKRVPTLTSTESAARAGQLLVELALDTTGMEVLPSELDDRLRAIARESPQAARAEHEALDADGLQGVTQVLLEHRLFIALSETLTDNELVYVGLPSGDEQPRRLITMTYEQELHSRAVGLRSLAEVLGWRQLTLMIDVGALGTAKSNEFRLESPDGVELGDSHLLTTPTPLEKLQHSVESTPGSVKVGVTDVPVGTRGYLLAGLRPERAYPSFVLAAALFAAALMTMGRLTLENLNGAEEGAVALLLAGPTLFGTAVAQPGRGTPAATLVIGARIALLLAVLMTFLAGWTLVALSEGTAQTTTWTILLSVSWILAVLLIPGVVRPGRQSDSS